MKRLILFLLFIPLISVAQEKGIHFEHNTTWENIKAQAKAENKHIFVDCYTTWCGPCKWMSDNVFVQEEVGEFFNKNFVNLKLQFDETKNDSEDVKSWYAEAKRFDKDYNINAYPTFLIFNPNGELVDKVVGGNEAEPFIARIEKTLNPETQYYTIKKQYESNPESSDLAHKVLSLALESGDDEFANIVFESILSKSSKEELFKEDNNLSIIMQLANKGTTTKAFQLIYDNQEAFDTFIGEKFGGKAKDLLGFIIIQKEIAPKLNHVETVDFDVLSKQLTEKYKKVDLKESIEGVKIFYYIEKKDWNTAVNLINQTINSKADITAFDLNDYAWTIFEQSDNKDALKAALSWSKLSIEKEENAFYLDTYANLLHKLGDTKNAIIWQEKAVDLVGDNRKEEFQTTLDKMKKGVATWE